MKNPSKQHEQTHYAVIVATLLSIWICSGAVIGKSILTLLCGLWAFHVRRTFKRARAAIGVS
jgi:hypothetical protein